MCFEHNTFSFLPLGQATFGPCLGSILAHKMVKICINNQISANMNARRNTMQARPEDGRVSISLYRYI